MEAIISKKKAKVDAPLPKADNLVAGQQQANTQNLAQVLQANRVNQVTPFGSITYSGDPLTGQTQELTLSPGAEGTLRNQEGLAQLLSGLGLDLAGSLNFSGPNMAGLPDRVGGLDASGLPAMPGLDLGGLPQRVAGLDLGALPGLRSGLDLSGLPQGVSSLDVSGLPSIPGLDDMAGERQRIEQAHFDRAMALLNPEFDRQRSRTDQLLADRGFDLERSQGAQSELNRLDQSQNLSRERAALDAIMAGGSEMDRMFGMGLAGRQQGMSELLANAGLANQGRDRAFGEMFTDATFGNQARGQALSEQMAHAGLADQARSAGFNEQMAAANLGMQQRGQGLAEALANAGLADQARTAGFNEQMALRNLPFQDLGALSALMPDLPMLNPGQPFTFGNAPVDVAGINLDAYNAALRKAELDQQAKAGFWNNITGLGRAAMGFI